MREFFFGVYQVASKIYNLRKHSKVSIYGPCQLWIYQGDALIISVKEESEEEMYEQATKALKNWIKQQGAHASSSTKGEQK